MSTAETQGTRSLGRGLLLHVAAPLAVGVAVYLLARPTPRVLRWLGASSTPTLHDLPRFVVAQIPDAAWAYALTAAVLIVWREGSRGARGAWGAVAVATAIGWELGQLAHVVPGRFDPADLVATIVACFVAIWSAPRPTPPVPQGAPCASIPVTSSRSSSSSLLQPSPSEARG